ncbi:hypothetical protein BDV11DRAFT_194717 [Aspergillus similis]
MYLDLELSAKPLSFFIWTCATCSGGGRLSFYFVFLFCTVHIEEPRTPGTRSKPGLLPEARHTDFGVYPYSVLRTTGQTTVRCRNLRRCQLSLASSHLQASLPSVP